MAGPANAVSRDGLHVAKRDRVVYVTLDRPAALNAIDDAMVDGLDRVLADVEADHAIRALVLDGRGEVFCVGMDLACLDRGFRDHGYFRRFLERLNTVLLRMEALPRGGGVVFENEIFGGAIPRQYVPAVEKGIRESAARGFLAGYPVVVPSGWCCSDPAPQPAGRCRSFGRDLYG